MTSEVIESRPERSYGHAMNGGNGHVQFGERLKDRRRILGLSQLQLAVDAGVSPRHLSFLETGRSQPSRDMVLKLAAQMRVPLREQNSLLLAAGFAPAFGQHDLAAPALDAVRSAAALVLKNHEPFPAAALDRKRNVVMANRGARLLLSGVAPALLGPPVNIHRVLLHPDGLSRNIVNFAEYRRHLLERLRRDAEQSGDVELHALFNELSAYPVSSGAGFTAASKADVALVFRFREAGGGELAFITTIATFGTPFDVTVSELVVESLFPADAFTEQRVRELARGAAG